MLTGNKGKGYLTNPAKKKAFTLVELIGVIAVLSIMLLVVVPAITNTIKNNDKRQYQDFEKAIINAAEAYVESNRGVYPTIETEGKAVVRLGYIINEGYLKSNLKDPSTKKIVSPNTYVTVFKQADNTLEYVYSGKDCELSDSSEGVGSKSEIIINEINGLPTEPGEAGEFAVVTNVDITDYIFSKNAPTIPKEGMLWIIIDESNDSVTFPHFVLPLAGCKQYINGAWQIKPIYIYQDKWTPLLKSEFVFNYTGNIQQATLVPGKYKLEVWGARGGNANNKSGGYGGYSTGVIEIKELAIMYIVAGEAGKQGPVSYNGGGSSTYKGGYETGSGGGATHIATKSGVLSSLANDKDSVLIVAGGGGGANFDGGTSSNCVNGGAGGGLTGGNGSGQGTAYGGTQTSAGSGGGFGYGANGPGGIYAGGGGGWYGGGRNNHDNASAAGGSGYLSSLLSDSSTKAGVNSSNGYAKITYIG